MRLLPLLLVACRPASDTAGKDSGAGSRAYSDADGATLALDADGSLVHTGADGVSRVFHLSLGAVTTPVETTNYDPWYLYDDDLQAAPSDLLFRAVTGASWDGAAFALTLEDDLHATLTVDDTGPGLRFTVTQVEGEPWAPYVRLTVAVDPDEAFYGLGEVFGQVQHRGQIVPMQFEISNELESGYNEAHVPIPLLVSSASWGLLVDSYRAGIFDVAAQDPDTVVVTFNQVGIAGQDGAGLTVDLYAPEAPWKVTSRYWQRTGLPETPPDWAYAPMQWRNTVSGSGEIFSDMEAIRRYHIPTGTIWVDNPWQTTLNSMTPSASMFPDWEELVATLHDQGFTLMAWSAPYLEAKDPDHDAYAASGWFVDVPLLLSDLGDWVDLTNDDAMAAWRARVELGETFGIEGWKLDYGEDAQLGLGAGRLVFGFANGEDERTMHHRYSAYYHQAYVDPAPDEAGFVLGRTGAIGGQALTDCIWPGDIDSGFERFGVEGRVGGLPAAIRAGTGLSVSGYPFFASDTGGFRWRRPTSEAMIRWTEYSATLPIMEYGGPDNRNPWDFTDYGKSHFTQETLDAFIRYAQLHIRLYPYFKLLADRVAAGGAPTILPQGLAWPEAGVHTDDSYGVGDDLFVAPVEEEGATTRTLTLPPGDWVHWWTGERLTGGAETTVDAPLGAGPLFQRAGSAIPMLRRTVVTLSPTTDPTVDSAAGNPGPLNARVVPGAGAGFVLPTGEALTAADAATVTMTAGTAYVGWDVEIHAPSATAVELDGAALAVGDEGCAACWIAASPWVRVIAGPGDHGIVVR